jgi:hypothetical protein
MGRAKRTLGAAACGGLRQASDAFSGVFGETRGTPQSEDEISSASYLARAFSLGRLKTRSNELADHPSFRPVLISHFVANKDIAGTWGARRVSVGIIIGKEASPAFAVLTTDRFGTGFDEPYETDIARFGLLDEAIAHAEAQLSIGPPLKNEEGTLNPNSVEASGISVEGFAMNFDILSLPT